MNQYKPKLILITGGVRSGKSSFAESLAMKIGGEIAYIATAQALDEEMTRRIAAHRQMRPKTWKTYEEAYQVERVIREIGYNVDVILIDCLTLLVSNLISDIKEGTSQLEMSTKIREKIEIIIREALQCEASVIIVSNEVGMGLVPTNPLGRFFRDTLGQVNQTIALNADQVYLLVAGIPLLLKGNPYD